MLLIIFATDVKPFYKKLLQKSHVLCKYSETKLSFVRIRRIVQFGRLEMLDAWHWNADGQGLLDCDDIPSWSASSNKIQIEAASPDSNPKLSPRFESTQKSYKSQ